MSEINQTAWISPLQDIDVVVGRSDIQHKCNWKTLRNNDWNLIILVAKNGAVRIGKDFFVMEEKSFYLFAPTKEPRTFFTEGWIAYWAHFPLQVAQGWPEFAPGGYSIVPSAVNYRRGKRDMMEAFQLAMGGQRGWHSLVLNLIQDVILRGNIQLAASVEDDRLLKAEMMLTDFRKPVDIERITAVCGMSRSIFYSHFQKRFGISPHAYRERGQLGMARVLLESTSLPLSEIASRCGIQDMAQFFKRFKRASGMTPTQYREKIFLPDKT